MLQIAAQEFTRSVQHVEAMQWDGTDAHMYLIMAWIKQNDGVVSIKSGQRDQGPDHMIVGSKGSGGTDAKRAGGGDWVVMLSRGEFRVHTDEDFKTIYGPKQEEITLAPDQSHPSTLLDRVYILCEDLSSDKKYHSRGDLLSYMDKHGFKYGAAISGLAE